MKGPLEAVEAFEILIKTRAGSRLEKSGGYNSTPNLMEEQKGFASPSYHRKYSIQCGNRRAYVSFRYDYRTDGCVASVFFNMSDIILIKKYAEELDRGRTSIGGNGHRNKFELKNVTTDGGEIEIRKDKIA